LFELTGRAWVLLGRQEVKSEWEVPRVSPYRLAAHLTSAAVIYCTLLWTSLSLAYPTPALLAAPPASALNAGVAALRRWAHPVAGLIAITALSGEFSWLEELGKL
jgi:cytochrome c oxidase assembly protein subunit 15